MSNATPSNSRRGIIVISGEFMKPRFCRYVAGEEQPYERMARIKKAIEDEQLGSVPPTDLTWDVLLPPFGENAFHTAAKFRQLRFFPSHLLKFDFLSRPDTNGNSAYHLAALSGCLNQIPAESNDVMKRLLALNNGHGQSILHCAFCLELKNLDAIPDSYLTRDWLTLRDNTGSTPLHLAASNRFVNLLLERNLVKLDDLFQKANDGVCALQLAALEDIDQLSPLPEEWGEKYQKIRKLLEPVLYYYADILTADIPSRQTDKKSRNWFIRLAQASIRYDR